MTPRAGAATLLGALLLTAGCGGSDSGKQTEGAFTGVPLEQQDPGPVHVHGLGYDPVGKVLYIATHTGMFELADGASKASRIGDSFQDTMGFSLVKSGLFLGSGHPDARDNLPPHLGLIKSTDQGRSWQPVSLTGDADFHVLRAEGSTVYGFDVTHERLLASSDAGRTWTKRAVPETIFDLAVDPADPKHLVASGGAVLYRSRDGGRTWKVVPSGVPGLLAWPTPARLYIATLDGAFLTAADAAGPGGHARRSAHLSLRSLRWADRPSSPRSTTEPSSDQPTVVRLGQSVQALDRPSQLEERSHEAHTHLQRRRDDRRCADLDPLRLRRKQR